MSCSGWFIGFFLRKKSRQRLRLPLGVLFLERLLKPLEDLVCFVFLVIYYLGQSNVVYTGLSWIMYDYVGYIGMHVCLFFD